MMFSLENDSITPFFDIMLKYNQDELRTCLQVLLSATVLTPL